MNRLTLVRPRASAAALPASSVIVVSARTWWNERCFRVQADYKLRIGPRPVTGLTTIAAARFHLTTARPSLISRVRSIPGPVAPANGSTGPCFCGARGHSLSRPPDRVILSPF